MSALHELLDSYRKAAKSEREKGTYFEELIICYLNNEPRYRDLYSDVFTYKDWAKKRGEDGRDAGIDLVATTKDGECHAVQCKLYAADYLLKKVDIDSFFTASGKKPFSRRIVVSSTNLWSEHAEEALRDQQPPVTKIALYDLENSKIDWSKYKSKTIPTLQKKKALRDHQRRALEAVNRGLMEAERGKVIMACGSGKTFTALKIAESQAGKGKRVLFLVPSLSLLSQTLTEWTQESEIPLHSFAVCSDSDVGKKRKKDDDIVQTFTHELSYPATTESSKLAIEMKKRHDNNHMSVVFSTYHSIDVISSAQNNYDLEGFDLIICDEAHRTTGATFGDMDESPFVKVHDATFISSKKRLYMTATPRIYGDGAKAVAERDNVAICSMDDEKLYGKELFVLTFSEAVRLGLLVDYKVIVLAVEEAHVSRRIQSLLKDPDNQLKVDDAAKIIGCWKALSKQDLSENLEGDAAAMQRAVAFCQVIEISKAGKAHKVSSKNIAGMFQSVVEAYQESEGLQEGVRLTCEAEHVDGSMNASQKEEKLQWLKSKSPENTCRILSNVRCLSEGVDVPALDAVLFLTPRNSQIDVVQSVGRVMRTSPGKKKGYVILPVVIPVGVEPHEALNDNKTYSVVWQVLQALRSHDDRFDALVNKLDLIGKDTNKMEIIALTDKIQKKQDKSAYDKSKVGASKNAFNLGSLSEKPGSHQDMPIKFEIGEIERAIYAKLVQKVGNRKHWEEWANDIAKIARTHIDRITGILEKPANVREKAAFLAFTNELRDDLNDSITDSDVIEMLAQHLITKPVFDALFEDYSFAQSNPMSIAMGSLLDILQDHHLNKEADTLQAFYSSVKERANGIDNWQGKQKIVLELYDKFFRNAFPKTTELLGIVYTPVEVVDFIIHSVNHILKTEFGETLGSEGVHIIDPFTGTGTFITRLLESGLIPREQLPNKYQNEIHANEIVLLAYYIAAINIEAVYHSIAGGKYKPFEGICLTDTFQLYEKDDLVDDLLEKNSARRSSQKKLDIQVIIGNPPYSAGQESANDNNQNVAYPILDDRIGNTYADRSKMTSVKNLYDSYIRAIRWASDRIGNSGVIGFVTNAGFLDSGSADGLRKCLVEEFSNIYVVHLRGNARTSGELRRKEKDNVFGIGSRAPIAISLLVKSPNAKHQGKIYFHDIGDYLSREDKLDKISEFASISGITQAEEWVTITPDQHGDWINQRDDGFSKFIVLGDKKGCELKLFNNYSLGIGTNRDVWCYNAAKDKVKANITRMISFYNSEVERFSQAFKDLDRKAREAKVNDFIIRDPSKISWSSSLISDLVSFKIGEFDENKLITCLYRPFTKQWLYYDGMFNHRLGQMPHIFPDATAKNLGILINTNWSGVGAFAIICDSAPDLHSNGDTQCFPIYLYDEPEHGDSKSSNSSQPTRENKIAGKRLDALTDEGLVHFQAAYPGEQITKEDIFYYVYGLLHSPDYCDRYADNLSKEIPRIPCVNAYNDFRAFTQAGRKLAVLHLNYETAEMYPLHIETGGKPLIDADYRVKKMKYGRTGREKDLTTLHYNEKIKVTGIPLISYDYIVNGKPALDWVVERQCVKIDQESGIVNDANDWAEHTMRNPRYPLELFQRVVTVSIETIKIVNSLPKLGILNG